MSENLGEPAPKKQRDSILWALGGFLAGAVTACVVMTGIHSFSSYLHPHPPELDPTNPEHAEQFREWIAQLPFSVLVWVPLAWTVGSLLGGMVAGKVGGSWGLAVATVLGILLTIAGVFNLLMFPMPLWAWIWGMLAFVPPALLGASLTQAPVQEEPPVEPT